MRMNILLMENLFYERRFERVTHSIGITDYDAKLTSRSSRYTTSRAVCAIVWFNLLVKKTKCCKHERLLLAFVTV